MAPAAAISSHHLAFLLSGPLHSNADAMDARKAVNATQVIVLKAFKDA
jgi:hypothetical protein